MADSNAIKAGEAYVELLTRNNTKAGVAEANKDIAQFGAAGSAQLTNVGKASLLANEAAKKSESAFDGFLGKVAKLAAVGAAAAKGFSSAFSASLNEVNRNLTKQGEALDYYLERLDKYRAKRNALSEVGEQPERKNLTEAAFNEELSRTLGLLIKVGFASADLAEKRKKSTIEFGGQKFDLGDMPIFGGAIKSIVDVSQTKLDQVKKELKSAIDSTNELGDKLKDIDNESKNPTQSVKSKAAIAGLVDLTNAFDVQRQSVSKTAEQMTVLNKQLEMLKEFGPDAAGWIGKATAPLLADATKTSTFLAKFNLGNQIRDINDELYWKSRSNALSVTGGTKGAFGSSLGSGQFEFGGGGPWAGMTLTLKDILEADLRIEKATYETNREIRRFGGDTFGP